MSQRHRWLLKSGAIRTKVTFLLRSDPNKARQAMFKLPREGSGASPQMHRTSCDMSKSEDRSSVPMRSCPLRASSQDLSSRFMACSHVRHTPHQPGKHKAPCRETRCRNPGTSNQCPCQLTSGPQTMASEPRCQGSSIRQLAERKPKAVDPGHFIR